MKHIYVSIVTLAALAGTQQVQAMTVESRNYNQAVASMPGEARQDFERYLSKGNQEPEIPVTNQELDKIREFSQLPYAYRFLQANTSDAQLQQLTHFFTNNLKNNRITDNELQKRISKNLECSFQFIMSVFHQQRLKKRMEEKKEGDDFNELKACFNTLEKRANKCGKWLDTVRTSGEEHLIILKAYCYLVESHEDTPTIRENHWKNHYKNRMLHTLRTGHSIKYYSNGLTADGAELLGQLTPLTMRKVLTQIYKGFTNPYANPTLITGTNYDKNSFSGKTPNGEVKEFSVEWLKELDALPFNFNGHLDDGVHLE